MNTTLAVYLHDRLVGHPSEADDAYLSFRYELAYLADPEYGPVSLSLPLENRVFDDH